MKANLKKYYSHHALMRYAKQLGTHEIHTKNDPKTGLQAIVVINNDTLGSAIGGCRFISYPGHDLALKDALRLAHGMTMKAAASDLAHGGGKAVVIRPKNPYNRSELFHAFGDFVDQFNGRYVTAMDMGTHPEDMKSVAERTPHVIGATQRDEKLLNPAPYTARGIYRGIQAAVTFKLGRTQLDGLRVAIQGGGNVAYHLAKLLYSEGVKLIICEPNLQRLQRFINEFNVEVVPRHGNPPDNQQQIYDVECDVFAPCAIGGTINRSTLGRVKAKIIAGAANNQLAHQQYGHHLHQRNILYAPDFVINAGGLIQAAAIHDGVDFAKIDESIEKIYDRLTLIFERAKQLDSPTNEVAFLVAAEKLKLSHQ